MEVGDVYVESYPTHKVWYLITEIKSLAIVYTGISETIHDGSLACMRFDMTEPIGSFTFLIHKGVIKKVDSPSIKLMFL